MTAAAPTASFEPYTSECSNWDHDDEWICPGCFHDLGNIGAGTHWCPECGRCVICTVDNDYPVCRARLATNENED